ncbi:MAG: hypothetical protein GF364_00465 [Candidatus Lokiarchaeota archaeon]|nr:hypothetical protein [Candidatus Lokiarchaeota archaeon]
MVKFRDQLRANLKDEIPNDVINLLPAGYQTLSDVLILNLKDEVIPYKEKIGNATLKLVPSISSVWMRTGTISGEFRKPTGLKHLAGERKTEIIHKENNLKYKFDFTKIMFAKGNITERRYLPKLVENKETIVDMFAGIGYFSLGIAKFANPNQIFSIELNPVAYNYLKENIKLNKLSDKIRPIHGDCKEEVPVLAKKGIKAERIIMGILPTPYEYIKAALTVIKQKELEIQTNIQEFVEKATETTKYDVYDRVQKPITNSIIHFEGVSLGKDIETIYNEFSQHAKNYEYRCCLLAFRFVKSFGPKMYHLVLDIAIGK